MYISLEKRASKASKERGLGCAVVVPSPFTTSTQHTPPFLPYCHPPITAPHAIVYAYVSLPHFKTVNLDVHHHRLLRGRGEACSGGGGGRGHGGSGLWWGLVRGGGASRGGGGGRGGGRDGLLLLLGAEGTGFLIWG